ncbi:MAG TPA: HAD family hydrolase [Rectinemataceae bacterium]|nr:HAD family hydrolase [Rectinemataceae bacterium]
MGIKAVGFDLDGTLYPAWLMYAVSVDIGLRHPRLLGAYSAARRALRTPDPSSSSDSISADDAKLTSRAFRARQASVVAQSLGADTDSVAHYIDTLIYSVIEKRFRFIRPYKGVYACMRTLQRSGLRLGLLSDLPPEKKVLSLGFSDFFSPILCSEDFGALKPDPRPFSALAAGFGVAPESILYVGNKHAYDILGAKAFGMKTAFIGRGKDADADFTFRRWDDLSRWILARV